MYEIPGHDQKARIFFMTWSVQILNELYDKILIGEILYGKEESLMKNFSINFEEENKNEEKKKKLKDVTEEYIKKYSIKLK